MIIKNVEKREFNKIIKNSNDIYLTSYLTDAISKDSEIKNLSMRAVKDKQRESGTYINKDNAVVLISLDNEEDLTYNIDNIEYADPIYLIDLTIRILIESCNDDIHENKLNILPSWREAIKNIYDNRLIIDFNHLKELVEKDIDIYS